MRFAVLACPCGQRWAVETRHETVRCPGCAKVHEAGRRTPLWLGETAQEATRAVQEALAHAAGVPIPATVPRVARHDSPRDAAAAQASSVINKSARAERVALWMTRLVGQPSHDELVDALQRAGLDRLRAEREIVRMLATDYLVEPRAGTYRTLAP